MGVPISDIHDFSQYPPQDLVALVTNPYDEKHYARIARVLEAVPFEGFTLRFASYDPSSRGWTFEERFMCEKFHHAEDCGRCVSVPQSIPIPARREPLRVFNRTTPQFNDRHGYFNLLGMLKDINWTRYEELTGRKTPTIVEEYQRLFEEPFIGNCTFASSDALMLISA